MADRSAVYAAVLADIAAGMTLRAAARKYKIPPGTVAVWWKRARDRGEAPERVVVKAEKLENPKKARPETASVAADEVKSKPPPPPRAREPMAPALRRGFQAGIVHRVSFLARPESLHHKDAKSIALQLKLMVEAAPDAVVFTTEPEERMDAATLADRVSAVFGTLDQPAGLTVVDGGKRATG